MLNSWFRALRDPTPAASDPNDSDSRDEDSSGVKAASLRGSEGEPGQITNNEGGFDGETFVSR